MRIYLDDVRDTPEGWVRCYFPEEVIELLKTGEVEELSLDFDLGFRGEEEWRTGEVPLQWLEEQVFTGQWHFPLPKIIVHSANPVGRARLKRAIDAIERRTAAEPLLQDDETQTLGRGFGHAGSDHLPS
jgi:hypothetical protein